jgi:Kdo2-lipid IVA lauroyltransferase/acyltransferase
MKDPATSTSTSALPSGSAPGPTAVEPVPLGPPPARRRSRRHRQTLLSRLWRPVRYRIEYASLRVCTAIASHVPRRLWLWCGARLGDMLYALRFYRRTVRKNMDYVGLWSPERQQQITRQLYRNMGRYGADFLRGTAKAPPAQFDNEPLLHQQMPPGQAGVVLFAHFGNWEILPALLERVGRSGEIIAKPMRNPLVESWLHSHRVQAGISFIEPALALRRCLHVLREGGLVALAIDQYPGRRGTPAPFLGRVTLTVRTSAALAVHTQCPVTAVYALLGEDGVYRVSAEAVATAAADGAEKAATVDRTLQIHNAVLSAWVQAHPEHWFGWFHRRFKDGIAY